MNNDNKKPDEFIQAIAEERFKEIERWQKWNEKADVLLSKFEMMKAKRVGHAC
jgi:hypothetical protein